MARNAVTILVESLLHLHKKYMPQIIPKNQQNRMIFMYLTVDIINNAQKHKKAKNYQPHKNKRIRNDARIVALTNIIDQNPKTKRADPEYLRNSC